MKEQAVSSLNSVGLVHQDGFSLNHLDHFFDSVIVIWFCGHKPSSLQFVVLTNDFLKVDLGILRNFQDYIKSV